jgi:hypothetical protein
LDATAGAAVWDLLVTDGVVLSGDVTGSLPGPLSVIDGADGTAIHDDVAGEIFAIAAKAVPVGADVILLEDSAAAFVKKRTPLTNLNLPTADQKAALVGTNGTPSAVNEYVTDSDPRNTNTRTPVAHATTHQDGGSDEVATTIPTADSIPKAGSDGTLDANWIPLPAGFLLTKMTYVLPQSISIGGPGAPVVSSVRNSTNTTNIKWTGTIVIDITTSGVNGLDTGAEAASTWYAVFVIAGGGNPVAGLLSTSSTAPTLPGSYTVFRRIGWVRNGAASDFLVFLQFGTGTDRVQYWTENQTVLAVLTNGAATTFTALSLATRVPPTSTNAYLRATHDAGSTGDYVSFRIGGSSLSDPATRVTGGTGGGGEGSDFFWIPTNSSQSIDYQNSSATEETDVWVLGFFESI